MKSPRSNPIRVLGIAPSTRGFGFALMEGENNLVDWGVKTVKGDKNARCLSNVANLIAHYKPSVIALENILAKESRRSARVRELIREITALAESENLKVRKFSRKQLSNDSTKQEIRKYGLAESLAQRFPQELGSRLPRKRRAWMTEDYRMDIFGAVALADRCLRGMAA